MDNAIVPFAERRYQEIPVEQIVVINPRQRDREQFDMNVTSIKDVGMMKPILVNDKFLERSGKYELVFGEGRLLAHKQLGLATIKAEVITCDRKEAYVKSLVENIARTRPGSMDFARELKRLHDEGWSFAQIGKLIGRSDNYVREYIVLVEKGEDRLIQGVEQELFPITFATQVADSCNGQMQHVLMDAFDEGLVTAKNFAQARKLILARARKEKKPVCTVEQLKQDIAEATQTKTSYVREAKSTESRFLTLLTGLNSLWQDAAFVRLLEEEQLHQRPALAGDFNYDMKEATHE